MSKKYTIEEVSYSFLSEGYKLLSTEYKNSHKKLKSLCPNGHIYEVSFTKWLYGNRCLCSVGKNRLNIEFIRKEFEKENYILLSNEYRNGEKLKYICPVGHKHSIRWDHFKAGHRCPYCNGRPFITIENVDEALRKEGYHLLSENYINSCNKFDYICPKGHKHSINWTNWNNGYRCPECALNMKKTLGYIKEEVEKENYKLVTEHYKNSRQKLHLICPKGHSYYVSWNNWKHQNSRCPQCNDWGTSKQEKTLITFIKTLCDNVIVHDRELISPYELDIVIPDKNITIEYCGLYWHSELAGKNRTYHLNKLNMCNEKGYQLITIFEDELVFNESLVFSRLKNFLHKENGKKIFARKCNIKEISTKRARIFCSNNHLQGYGSGSKVKLGLFYSNELLSVMTFSKPSIAKGARTDDLTIWELNRFCSKENYRVIGGASKLLKYFERNYHWKKIFSYADRRWSIGNVYEKLNFKLVESVRPNYWYIRNQQRLHRFNLRKKYDDDKHLTEWDIRKAQGWNRIWDCGNLRYQKELTNLSNK